MSISNKRKKSRKQFAENSIDYTAEHENNALKKIQMIGNVQQPRLNRTYTCDGYVFLTGKKHRYGGGVSVTDERIQPMMLWDIK